MVRQTNIIKCRVSELNMQKINVCISLNKIVSKFDAKLLKIALYFVVLEIIKKIRWIYALVFCLFSSDTLQVLMFVCPLLSELRFYGCCHPCWLKTKYITDYKTNRNKFVRFRLLMWTSCIGQILHDWDVCEGIG